MKKLAVLLSMILTMAGCATIISGTDQTLTFTSDPEDVQVIVDGQPIGVTPLTVSLKKNKFDTVMFKREGFKTQTFPLEQSFDGITLLSIFWDIGTTDVISGAAWEYAPGQYHVIMKAKEESMMPIQPNTSLELKSLVLNFGTEIREQLMTTPGDALITLKGIIAKGGAVADDASLRLLADRTTDDLQFGNDIIDFYGLSGS